MTAKKFRNFSKEDFTWKWDGVVYTFKAGQEIYMEDYKADHFAKHLIDRELTRQNIQTNHHGERAKLALLCFPPDEVVSVAEAIDIEAKKEESIRTEVKAKRGRPSKKVEIEEEFSDLNKHE